jgi:hypothetical protein
MIFGEVFGTRFDNHAPLNIYLTCSLDAIMARVPIATYQIDSMLRGFGRSSYIMSGRLGIPSPNYTMDALLILDENDSRRYESFVNALMWAFANEWRLAARAINMSASRMKLDYANTDDLDEHWGVILNLKRRYGEDDESYRLRLSTRVRILTSSGTKPNCQTIIDHIIDAPGGSRLETFSPASVVLSWTSPDAIEAAIAKQDLIADAMDKMIAGGVSWSTSYPKISYTMAFDRMYHDIVTYDMDGAISKKRGIVYRMSGGMWNAVGLTYNCDGLLYSKENTSYKIQSRLLEFPRVTYSMQSTLSDVTEFTHNIAYDIDAAISKANRRFYTMGGDLT